MDNIRIFQNEQFGQVRIAMNEKGEPLFCLADVCKSVELTNPSSVKSRLDKEDVQLIDFHALNYTEGIGNTLANFITESGFYDVLLQSSSKKVKPFRKWVTREVLPSIRKTGGYMIAKADDTPETIMARALVVAKETLDRQQAQISQLHAYNQLQEKELKQAAPKVEYYDTAMSGQGTYSATDIAKDLGMSAKTLNKKLHALRIQYKQNDTWYLYAEYQDKGYTRIVPNYITDRNGETVNHPSMRWTEKGRKLILSLQTKGKI